MTTAIANTNGPAPSASQLAKAEQAASPKRQLKDLLDASKQSMQMVLPKHLSADKLIKVSLVAVSRTPLLQQCTPETILQSVMQAAQLGLDCGGALGSAYLVPFKKSVKDAAGKWHSHYECQLIVGYRGLIDLARRSGQLESIEARPVFQGERFELAFGLDPKLVHVPDITQAPDPSQLMGCYVVARFKDGGHHVEWMSRPEIDSIRGRSKAKDAGPWVTDYVEMAKKTVVRRAAKYLPLSADLATALDLEREREERDLTTASVGAHGVDALPAASKASQLASRLGADAGGPDIVADSPAEDAGAGSDEAPTGEEQAEAATEPSPAPKGKTPKPAADPKPAASIADRIKALNPLGAKCFADVQAACREATGCDEATAQKAAIAWLGGVGFEIDELVAGKVREAVIKALDDADWVQFT